MSAGLYVLLVFATSYLSSHQHGNIASLWHANTAAIMYLQLRQPRDWPALLRLIMLINLIVSWIIASSLQFALITSPGYSILAALLESAGYVPISIALIILAIYGFFSDTTLGILLVSIVLENSIVNRFLLSGTQGKDIPL